MSRLVMLPMRRKCQSFCWFRHGSQLFVSDRLRSVGTPRYSAVKSSRSRLSGGTSGINTRVGPVAQKQRSSRASGYPVIASPATSRGQAGGMGRPDKRRGAGGRTAGSCGLYGLAPAHRFAYVSRKGADLEEIGSSIEAHRTWRQSKLSVQWEARMTFPNPPSLPRCVSLESRSVTKSQTGASWRLAKNLCSRLSTRYRW